MSSSRREFLLGASRLILILPVGFSFAGCGNAATNNAASCPDAGKVVATSTTLVVTSSCDSSHTHDFTLMTAELMTPPAAGVTRDSSTDAFDGHTHSVMLSAGELGQIEAGTAVTKTSSTVNSHSHNFVFKKA